MSELKTDFKDEILQEGELHRVYNIKRKGTDEVVESEIYLEKAYDPQQEGDEFGAKYINETNRLLNDIVNGTEVLGKYLYLDGSTVPTDKNWDELEVNKIYLTSGTYKTSNNAPIDGNLWGVLIYANMTNGAVQLYLPRLETGKIYLRGKYSSAWREWMCSADGGDASTIDGVSISDIVQKSKSGMLQFPTTVDSGLTIGLTGGVGSGKLELINNYSDVSKATNIPISQMIAVKQTFVSSSTMGLVRLYELWPVRGRVWQNEYNSGSSPQWNGWKLVQGEYTLWTGSAQQEQGVTLSESYKKFGHIEIRSATGVVFEVPTYSQSTYDGRVYKGGDDLDFNLYGLNVEFTADKNMYIAKAGIRSLMNSTTSKFTVARVTGKP